MNVAGLPGHLKRKLSRPNFDYRETRSARYMFERYTEKARRVIFFARYEASQFGSQTIEPEHILLGLAREDRILFKGYFKSAQISIKFIRDEIENRTSLKEKIWTSVELPLASASKRILTYAHEESDKLGHRHIGTEHLLLGILREGNSMVANALLEHGFSIEELRKEIANHQTAASETDGSFPQELRRSLNTNIGIPAAISSTFPRRTVLGLEKLLEARLDVLRDARVGLVCNQASVDHKLEHAADLLYRHQGINLTALFGPQHGIRGDVQDNMIETEHAVDRATGLPIHSLYSETREPTDAMLRDVDILVFDMQDVGCRIYTFAYTMANCMRAARRLNKKVIVCDRPNPINGIGVSGNVLEPEQSSFVGQFPIPTRHGMTMGELARMFNGHFGIGCDLEVIEMEGWDRTYWHEQTNAPWVMPSPNIPTVDSATVFPGTVHFEGTQLSEGRGTTRPFELVGAPYIVPEEYAGELNNIGFSGVFFRSCVFRPTFQKHAGVSCGGVQVHVTDRDAFEPVIVGIAMVKVAYDMYADLFRWKDTPYEYVYDRSPFDVIAGTTRVREAIEQGSTVEEIQKSWEAPLAEFRQVRGEYLLY